MSLDWNKNPLYSAPLKKAFNNSRNNDGEFSNDESTQEVYKQLSNKQDIRIDIQKIKCPALRARHF